MRATRAMAHGPRELLQPCIKRRRVAQSAREPLSRFCVFGDVWHFAFTLIVSGAAPGVRLPLRTRCQTCGVPLIHTCHSTVNSRPPHRLLFTPAFRSFGQRHAAARQLIRVLYLYPVRIMSVLCVSVRIHVLCCIASVSCTYLCVLSGYVHNTVKIQNVSSYPGQLYRDTI